MRLKYSKILTFSIITINIVLVYYVWKFFLADVNVLSEQNYSLDIVTTKPKLKDRIQSTNKHIKKVITIIFREFYHFDTDLHKSIDSILHLIPNVQILVLYNEEPYPPMEFASNLSSKSNVRFINLNFDIRKSMKSLPINSIKTKYILFMPDSVRLGGRSIIQKMLKEIERIPNYILKLTGVPDKLDKANVLSNNEKLDLDKSSGRQTSESKFNKRVLVIPFASEIKSKLNSCCKINMDFSNWSLEYNCNNKTDDCDIYINKHAILVESALVKSLPDPFGYPFPDMFYIQAKAVDAKLILLSSHLNDGKKLSTALHNKQQKQEIRRNQFKEMYTKLQIKKVVHIEYGKSQYDNQKRGVKGKGHKHMIENIDGNNINFINKTVKSTIEYYGCEKNTKSCIGSIYNRKPFYIYLGKHAPPCCVEKLKQVFFHVMEEFQNVGIRYWLDNFALKSSIEYNGHLSTDLYEIDISFIGFDLERSQSLKKCQNRPFTDTSGFYWIKATDGQYFRVQYSKVNQIAVNLLPFDIDGDRIVPSGFFGWKAKEFSSEFLHPMSTVVLLGRNVMCPNNVREFLELKKLH